MKCPKCSEEGKRLSDHPGVNGWVFYCKDCEFVYPENYDPSEDKKTISRKKKRTRRSEQCPKCSSELIAAKGKGHYSVWCPKCKFKAHHPGMKLKEVWDIYKKKNRYG